MSSEADWVPLVSQVKSAFQLISCDAKGSRETQYNFVTRCPLIAHILGLVIWPFHRDFGRSAIKGGTETVITLLDATPVVGYIMALLFRLLGKSKRARKSFLISCRTTAVAIVGSIGYVLGTVLTALFVSISQGGPILGFTGAAVAGLFIDALRCTQEPIKGKEGIWILMDRRRLGDWFDAIYAMVQDGLTGYETFILFKLTFSYSELLEAVLLGS